MTAPTPMTADEIEALRDLERKATPGEWLVRPLRNDDWGYIRSFDGEVVAIARAGRYLQFSDLDAYRAAKTDPSEHNAAFIAAARNAIPRLLATIDAQRAEIEQKDALLHAAREQLGGTTAILLPILEQIDVDIDATTITINRVGPAGTTPVERVSLRVLAERNAALDIAPRAALKEPAMTDAPKPDDVTALVERLRTIVIIGDGSPQIPLDNASIQDAADALERLAADNVRLTRERDELLRRRRYPSCQAANEAADDAEAALAAARAENDRLRDALTDIKNQPESYNDGTQSYSVGYAFYLIQCRARAALKQGGGDER